MDTAWTFRTSIVVDHYHQPTPVPSERARYLSSENTGIRNHQDRNPW